MKITYSLIAILLCTTAFFACNGPTVQKEADTIKNVADTISKSSVSDTTGKAKVLNSNDEYIDWDIVRINGKLPPISTIKLLYSTLGKPDSVVTPNMDHVCVSFYDKPFKNVYIKGSNFELYGDTVVISTLNFKQSGITLTAGKLALNGNTTLADIAKFFPKAVKDPSNVEVDTFGKVIMISVNTSKTPGDDAWLLMFKNGKLVQMDYWMPC